jgi:small-conductance mechanosensitive channel
MMAGTIDHTMPSRSAADTSSASVPGEQFPIRRRAYQRIKALFDLNGVKFAVPKVQVAEARRLSRLPHSPICGLYQPRRALRKPDQSMM